MTFLRSTALAAAGNSLALVQQASAPGFEADKAKIYAKLVSGVVEMFVRDSLGQEVQITNNGAVNGGGGGSSLTYSTTLYAGTFTPVANEIARWNNGAAGPHTANLPLPGSLADGDVIGFQATAFSFAAGLTINFTGGALLFGALPSLTLPAATPGGNEWKFRFDSTGGGRWYLVNGFDAYALAINGNNAVLTLDSSGDYAVLNLDPQQTIANLGSGVIDAPYQLPMDASNLSVSFTAGTANMTYLYNPEGQVITLPTSPMDGDEFAARDVTGCTDGMYFCASGANLETDAPGVMASGNLANTRTFSYHHWKYRALNNTWYRVNPPLLPVIKSQGSAIAGFERGISSLDLRNSDISVSSCGGPGEATVRIPTGFPLNITYSVCGTFSPTGGGQARVWNCSTAADCVLDLPNSPVHGDQVGALNRGGAGFYVLAAGSFPVWIPGYATACSTGPIGPTPADRPMVWRFNGSANEWEYVIA